MNDLIKLVRTYRVTAGLAERLQLAEDIFRQIEPDLRLFVSRRVEAAADDVLQDVLIGIAVGIVDFKGNSEEEFYGWCYQIARHKIVDYIRKRKSDRLQPMEPEILGEMFNDVVQDSGLSADDRIDLQGAMKMLKEANGECHDVLWRHFIDGLTYTEIADERAVSYDAVRMRIGRCLELAQSLFP